jgi:hypothetical protein
MLAPRPGPNQNIYAPWPLEQNNGWLLFYGGWDGTATPNDRVYNVPTPDFLAFGNRALVIDHGSFQHVNNENVVELPDGSMHMICTVLTDPLGLDKPAYFSSPDGKTWNGSPEPYAAQLSDSVPDISDNSAYGRTDYNGGNVLVHDNNLWTLYYSSGLYAGPDGSRVFRATSTNPPYFQSEGSVADTNSYANDVKKFKVSGETWYVMLLYIEELMFGEVVSPVFAYRLSND